MQKPAKAPIKIDPVEGTWIMFPEMIPFRGFEDREDESQLQGAWVLGQNVKFRKAGLPTLRNGSEILGTLNEDITPVTRAWTFEDRNGEQWELKVYDTKIYYWLQGVSTDWALLMDGLTTNLEMGYAIIDETSDATNYSFFCNGTDEWYKFNGSKGTVDSVTSNTIVFTDTIANLAFLTAGTRSVIIDGTVYTYTGEAASSLTGVTPDPSVGGVSAGDLAIQSPQSVAALTDVKSSVMLAHDGRIHARLETKKNVWNYSKLNNPDDFTTGATDGDGGSKAIEGGGGVVAYAGFYKTILAFTRRGIKSLIFSQSGDRVDVPVYDALTPTDGKTTSLGATNQRSTITTPHGIVFITPDKRMVLLTGVTNNENPQYLTISDPIQPIFDAGDHRNAVAFCADNVLYYSFKSSPDANQNDTVITGDLTRQSRDRLGQMIPIQWDMPIVGWGVNDFTAIQNSDGKTEVHFHSSENSNSYKIITDSKSDDGFGFTATVRSWAENFGYPQFRKEIDAVFIEIKMKESSEVLATVFYDENGFSKENERTLYGTDTGNRFYAPFYNAFGASKFGSEKFGSNEENDDLTTYRYFIELSHTIKSFNVSLQLSGDTDGNDFELVRFGYHLKRIEKVTPRELKK